MTTGLDVTSAGSRPGGGPPAAEALRLYESMVLIRRVEERLRDDSAAGKLPGAVHLYIGEEAVAAGVCAHLGDRDYATSTHRGHGHFLAKGGDVRAMMAEIWAKREGICRGMGGSMHVADISKGILGANGIVDAGLSIATGAAFGVRGCITSPSSERSGSGRKTPPPSPTRNSSACSAGRWVGDALRSCGGRRRPALGPRDRIRARRRRPGRSASRRPPAGSGRAWPAARRTCRRSGSHPWVLGITPSSEN